MEEPLVEALGRCRSLSEFHALCGPGGLHGADPRFLHLELDIINRCNIRCVMCYHSLESARRARTAMMTPDDFARIAARVLPHAYHLSLSLGNEPLTSPHFADILRIVATHLVPHVNFFTNGLLLTDAVIGAIVRYGVTQVCVSIDGATPATYHAIRRDGEFDRLVGNVERLIARRNAAGRVLPRVRFDVVMMRRNVHELPEIVTLAARLGVEELSFRHLVAFEGLGMESESLHHTKALSNYWLERALTVAAELRLDVQTRPAFFDLPDGDGTPAAPEDVPFLPTPYCPFPFFHATVSPAGHVLPCPYSHGEPPYGQVSAGEPLAAIWLGPKFTALRQRILRHDPPAMCRKCSFLSDRYPNVAAFFATRRH